jgi:hypothetical protein
MKVPVVSGSDAAKAFGNSDTNSIVKKDSHIILRRGEPPHRRLSVPNH